MHYRLGFSSKLENPSVYIECSVRKPGIRHPVREIVKRFGKKKDLLAQDPLALEKIRQEVDEMNRNCKGRQLVSSPSSLKTLSADLSELLEQQSLDGQAVFESRIAGCLILQRLYDQRHHFTAPDGAKHAFTVCCVVLQSGHDNKCFVLSS